MKWILKGLAAIAIWAIGVSTYAEIIQFPTEELANESVLPRFDKVGSVKNRNVKTTGKIKFSGGLGLNLMEALYNTLTFHGSVTYHIDEIHGISLATIWWQGGLSSYGEQLKNGEGLSGDSFDARKAPNPKYLGVVDYQHTAFYGKVSLSKQSVINFSSYGLVGAGTIGMGDSNNLALNIGFGQDFYFSSGLVLRLDFRLLTYRGPDPTSRRLTVSHPKQPVSAFDKANFFHSIMTLSLAYLL